MRELRAFPTGRLTADPSLDTDALVTEFVSSFYGEKAAPFVHTYMETMRHAAQQQAEQNGPPLTPNPSAAYLTNQTVLRAAAALSQALQALDRYQDESSAAAASTAAYRDRVLRSSVSINYLVLLRWDEYVSFARGRGETWPLATANKRRFFSGHFAVPAVLNATGLLTGIAVPTCGGWVLGENCWNKQGNISDFERFLFPE